MANAVIEADFSMLIMKGPRRREDTIATLSIIHVTPRERDESLSLTASGVYP